MNMTEKAREFVISAHGRQKYGNRPYIYHLDMTWEIANEFNLSSDVQVACYLHDVLEDTDVKFEEIWDEFGWEVAQLVFLVTDEWGRNRRERKDKTIPKIRSNENAVQIKLCDRIANIKSCMLDGNKSLLKMYVDEDSHFQSVTDSEDFDDVRTLRLAEAYIAIISDAKQIFKK